MTNLDRRGDAKIVLIVIACVVGFGVLACGVLAALLFPAVQQARTAARRVQSKNNMKEMALSTHNYHDVYKKFPAASQVPEDGMAPNSWQVSMLPFLEQMSLYESMQVQGDTWDVAERRPALSSLVRTFQNPNLAELTLPNGYASSHYAGSSQVFVDGDGMKINDVVDGTSMTVMGGEVNIAFRSWGDPGNVRDPADGLGSGPNQFGPAGGANVTQMFFLDGSVHAVSNNISPDVLKALSTPAGREVVDYDEF